MVRENGKFNCDQCDKTFASRGSLYYHRKFGHQGFRYVCDHCDKQFTMQDNLKRHIESKHVKVKYAR